MMRSLHLNPSRRKSILLSTIPLVVYLFILLLPLPDSIGMIIRQEFGTGTLLILLVLIGGNSFGKNQNWISLTILYILFGTELTTLWSIPISEGQVVGGMLYFSDASRYYADALRLLYGFPISTFSARHPMSTIFLACFLWSTGKNIRVTFAVITGIAAWVSWSASQEVRVRWGKIPAAIFSFLLFLFYRRYIGSPDSENMGFIFGCLGFTILLKSIRLFSPRFFWSGLFTLTVGLTARPGTFLVLPFICLWQWKTSTCSIPSRVKMLFVSIFCIASVFFINFSLNKVMADENSRLFSNFSYTFYGISQGGMGWEQFLRDHPEYLHSAEIVAERAAFTEGLNSFLQDPALTIQGILKTYRDFFSLSPISVFGFLGTDLSRKSSNNYTSLQLGLNYFFRFCAMLFSLWGLFFLIRDRKNMIHHLLLWVGIGIMASVPFLPPIDAGRMRVYIATIPFILVFPAIGFHHVTKLQSSDLSFPDELSVPKEILVSGFLVTIILFSPIATRFLSRLPIKSIPNCSDSSLSKAIIELAPGNYLRLGEDVAMPELFSYDIGHSDFQSSYAFFPREDLIPSFDSIPPNRLLMNSINLLDGQQLWIILPLKNELYVGSKLSVCGFWDPRFLKNGLGFLDVQDTQKFGTH